MTEPNPTVRHHEDQGAIKRGPLAGLKIIEFASIGPGPFCGMLLADLGAAVLRLERPNQLTAPTDILKRGRRTLAIDLKAAGSTAQCLRWAAEADAIFEGNRPGVMERLGLGPEALMAVNPRLIYGRLTGWGQTGPLSQSAGHDINYISLCGLMSAIGARDRPIPPLNVIGDYAGGGLYMALGLVSALLCVRSSGVGQVVDAAMCDGAASLSAMFHSLSAAGKWQHSRQANVLDGGSHFYGAYCCADGGWLSVAPMEPQFYRLFCALLQLPQEVFGDRDDPQRWPQQREALEVLFASRARAEWLEILGGTDACVTPILGLMEAPLHPHNRAREAFIMIDKVPHPAPAPRFSATPPAPPRPPEPPSDDHELVIRRWRADAGGH